jgi:hypothetical protein
LPPYALTPLFEIGDIDFRPEIEEAVPAAVWDKMMKIPYCIQASDPNGMEIDQFNTHPSTVRHGSCFLQSFCWVGGLR